MNRRNFIRNGTLASIVGASGFAYLSSCTKPSEEQKLPETAGPPEFVLNEVTIDELQQKMQSGEMTSKSITELYLKRIQEIDKEGPKLNSVIELNPDAIAIAETLDQERKEGKIRGHLHGIPIREIR